MIESSALTYARPERIAETMIYRRQPRWLIHLLLAGNLTAALALLLLVVLAPLLCTGEEAAGDFLALCAGDAFVRRTLIASGVGLTVTALVFFRAPPRPLLGKPAPQRIVGA